MILKRTEIGPEGAFGTLRDDENDYFLLGVTLEHAYPQGQLYAPKIPDGTWDCILGAHHLDKLGWIDTYELCGVPGHTGLLIHPGNYQSDSNGCILLGRSITMEANQKIITQSKLTFKAFMDYCKGRSHFTLEVGSK